MNQFLLPHDGVVGWLLGQVPDDAKRRFKAGSVALWMDVSGNHLKAIKFVDEDPVG